MFIMPRAWWISSQRGLLEICWYYWKIIIKGLSQKNNNDFGEELFEQHPIVYDKSLTVPRSKLNQYWTKRSKDIDLDISLICLRCQILKKQFNGCEIIIIFGCNFSKTLCTLPLYGGNSYESQLQAGWWKKKKRLCFWLIYFEKLLLQTRPLGGDGVNNLYE